MRRLTLVIFACIALSALAQNKINAPGLIALHKYQQQKTESRGSLTPHNVSVLVGMAQGHSPQALTEAGYSVDHILNSYAIVTLPIERVNQLAELEQVRTVSFGGKRQMKMAHARKASGVDNSHSGITHANGTSSFTGHGVVLGLFDGGLDPNHPNFVNPDGISRVSRLWFFDDDNSTHTVDYTASNIASFTTDDEYETHATHVAGIMGGSYNRTGKYVNHTSASTGAGTIVSNGNIPFYGVATGAELAFSCGSFADACILAGVENIINYAEQQGKPAVVNLSLGSNYGPHDGTDDFSRALDELGERAIICVAAGNEGSDNISIHHVCTSANPTVKTLLFYNNNYTTSNNGPLDIWTSDGVAPTIKVYNVNSSGTVSNSTTLSKNSNGASITRGVRSGGYLDYYSGVDANNGRYNAFLYFDNALPASGRFAIEITGTPGQEIDIYFSGYSEFSNSYYNNTSNILSGFTKGTPDQSISGMACGKNIVTVGSYNTLAKFRSIGSSAADSFNETLGEISSFSSYGSDFFGRQLPHLIAPGSAIISSYSRRYVAKGYDYETASDMCASTTHNGNTEYWGPMQGTSMATPYMSGVAALWLEADPTLTISDVLDVIAKTSTPFGGRATTAERSGAGILNADKGLEYIIEKASVGSIISDDKALVTTVEGGTLTVTLAGAETLDAKIFDMQGRQVASQSSRSNKLSIPTHSIQSGVYILSVSSSTSKITKKLLL